MNRPVASAVWLLRCILGIYLLAGRSAAQPSVADQSANKESSQHGFPAMLDSQGKKLADGEFVQWVEKEILHVKIDYDFGNGRRIEEKTSFQQTPRLVQEEWSWSESIKGQMVRHFEVDFKTGKGVAKKGDGKEMKSWSEDLKIEPARMFAGFGFVLAIKTIRERLLKGEKIELRAIGFTPKPRVVSVEISYGGKDQLTMANRMVNSDRFTIHPKVPAIAKAFVEVKDTQIWLTPPPAVSFLRWEGPLVESSDPVVRVDLLP